MNYFIISTVSWDRDRGYHQFITHAQNILQGKAEFRFSYPILITYWQVILCWDTRKRSFGSLQGFVKKCPFGGVKDETSMGEINEIGVTYNYSKPIGFSILYKARVLSHFQFMCLLYVSFCKWPLIFGGLKSKS